MSATNAPGHPLIVQDLRDTVLTGGKGGDGASGGIGGGGGGINIQNTANQMNYYGQQIFIGTVEEGYKMLSLQDRSNTPTFYRPNSSTAFQGRQVELDKLKNHFKSRSIGEPLTRRSLLLYGMGGIGKTQVCLKFIEETSDRFSHIFWIDASTPETTTQSLKGISEAKSATKDGSAGSILHWISCLEEEWLLVFDSADEHIHKFIPPGNLGNILITSRNPSVRRSTSFNDLEIGQMDEQDAVALLLKVACAGQDTSSDALQNIAREIISELHCLPLAIDQAAAAIQSGACPIDGYLQMYHDYRRELLDDPAFKNASSYEQTAYGTWEVSYKGIESRAVALESPAVGFSVQAAQTAILILEIFACLHHDNIPKAMFQHAATEKNIVTRISEISGGLTMQHGLLYQTKDGKWNELHFQNGIRVLLSFSLIKQNKSGNMYSIHPLVHSWSQDRMSLHDQKLNCKKTNALLSASVSFSDTSEDYHFHHHLIPHVEANFQFAIQIQIGQLYDDNDCTRFGYVFNQIGEWTSAEKLLTQALNTRKNTHGIEHPDTLTTMGHLALTYKNQGRWKESENLGNQVLKLRKKVLGLNHHDTLMSMSNLTSIYTNQGRWEEAENLGTQVLDSCKKVLGLEHPDTLKSMGILASVYGNQGRWKEAEELVKQALDFNKKVLGLKHPYTLSSMGLLALLYTNQGKWKEGENLGSQALDLFKEVLGLKHPLTLQSMGILTSVYGSQGKWEEAEVLINQVLDLSKKIIELKHPDTLINMGYLAAIYTNQGRWKEAEDLGHQVLDLSKEVLGMKHPNTLRNMDILASVYRGQGKWKEAENLGGQVLSSSKEVLGLKHPDTIMSMVALASVYGLQERWKEAEELMNQVLDLSKEVLGLKHPETLIRMEFLILACGYQEKWKEAEELENQLLELRKEVFGLRHPDTVRSMAYVARLISLIHGRNEEARTLLTQALQIGKDILGDEHPEMQT